MAWLPLTLLTCSPNTHQGDPLDHQIKRSSLYPESTPNQLMALSATMVLLAGILFHQLWSATTVSSLKSKLKTYLFSQTFSYV